MGWSLRADAGSNTRARMCRRRWELSFLYELLQRRKCESSVQEDMRSLLCRRRCELSLLYEVLQHRKCESSLQEDVWALLIKQSWWRWRRQLTALSRHLFLGGTKHNDSSIGEQR